MEKLGADLMGFTTADITAAVNTSTTNDSERQLVHKFLRACEQIKYEVRHYLFFSVKHNYYSDYQRYVKLDSQNLSVFQGLVEKYQRVSYSQYLNFGPKDYLQDLKIVKTYHYLGLPHPQNYSCAERATTEELNLLVASIPSKPTFEKIKKWEVHQEFSHIAEFSASEADMQELFNRKLHMDKKNYFRYDNIDIEIEAGRGTKWYLKTYHQAHSEGLRDLIVRNCPSVVPGEVLEVEASDAEDQ